MYVESHTEQEIQPERHLTVVPSNADSDVTSEVACDLASNLANDLTHIANSITVPMGASQVAKLFGVNRNLPPIWLSQIAMAYPWLADDLKINKKYTPQCLHLMVELHQATQSEKLTYDEWIERIHTSEEYQTWKQSQPQRGNEPLAIRPDVLPSEDEYADRRPPVDRTAAGSIVPTGNTYLNALEEEELELERLESEELALLNRMAGNLTRLTQNQTQWNRTNDLRRQRLLRQTRLEAAALATELEAEFDETLRESQYNIRRGNVVGKSPVGSQQSPSA